MIYTTCCMRRMGVKDLNLKVCFDQSGYFRSYGMGAIVPANEN